MRYLESEKVELKQRFTKAIAGEIVAFLNGEGGTIYIGVGDDGTITGVENSDKTLLELADIVTTQIEPNPQELIHTEIVFEESKILIRVLIQKGFFPIYYLKKYGFSSKGCLIRIGTSTREMTNDQITIRYAKRFSSLNDAMVMLPARYGDISFDILKILLDTRGFNVNPVSFERNYQLKDENGHYNMLAELMSDRNNIPFEFVKFSGKDKSKVAERNDYGHCCIIDAYHHILGRLKSENICKADTSAVPRKDTYLYDMDAVKEVLLNAIIHNDWNITEPLVCFFSDRLEIISHGGLPGNQTKENFFNGITVPRNAALMRIFHDLDIAEHNGHGIPTVVSVYGKDVFYITDNYINVRIPFNKEVLKNHLNLYSILFDGYDGGNLSGILSEKESVIVELLIVNGHRTLGDISRETGIPKRTVSRIIADLQRKKIIVREGSKREGRWKVIS